MTQSIKIALSALALMAVFAAPSMAQDDANTDPIITTSVEKPVKTGSTLYPINALAGLNF